MARISPVPRLQFFDDNGDPLVGGKLYTYASGTETPLATYTDAGGGTPHTNPIILDSRGEVSLWLGNSLYDFVLHDANDAPVYTAEDIGVGVADDIYFSIVNGPSGVIQDALEGLIEERTLSEIAAGVTPTNYYYPEGNLLRYGADPTGVNISTTAIQNAINVANQTTGRQVDAPAGTFLTGKINWPGNNISLRGAGCGYSYNTSATPKTIFKATETIVFDLVQTGLAEDRTGNYLVDFEVDGNGIAEKGIECAGSNIIERVRVRGCTGAGVQLSNFTNGTRIVRCGLNQNSGWGLKIEGVSSTTYSVTDTNISLNTLGGVDIQTGVLVSFRNCVIESNSGPGIRFYKPNTHTNAFEGFLFDTVWIEDNASTAPNFSLVFDSGTSSPTYGVQRVKFFNCRTTASEVTRKYANINICKWVEFENCQFDNSTQSDALTGSSNAHNVSFINCQNTGSTGITATQMDNGVSQGYNWWWHDTEIKRAVGGASPAVAFQNSWVNYDGGFTPARYYFESDGSVCIDGSVKSGTVGTAVFTLPAGYRPATQKAFACDGAGAHSLIYITPGGEVQVNVGSNVIQHLNGIIFDRL